MVDFGHRSRGIRHGDVGRFSGYRLFRQEFRLFPASLSVFAGVGVLLQRRRILYFPYLPYRHPPFVAARSMEARGRYPAQRAADAPHTVVLARRDDLQGDRSLRGAGSVRDGLYAHYGARADDSALRCDHPLAHPADEPYPHAGIRCRVEGGGARHAVAELAALRHVRIHHLRPPAQILRDRRTAGLLFRDGGEYRIRARQVRNRSHSFRQLRQCEGRVGPPDQILRDARRQGVDRPGRSTRSSTGNWRIRAASATSRSKTCWDARR